MDILQNRPGSYRLNYADFGEVYRGPCVKGVITEFKQIQDDPITVQSLVKVDLGGDFIPIFFHPKPLYWDDDQHQATDLNEDGKYFEKAWQSFRCGDEVAVPLQGTQGGDLKPFAVLAFADGVPRIGEDIIKVVAPDPQGNSHFFHLQCSNQGLYGSLDEAKTGPDGLALGLTEEHAGQGDYYQRPPNQYYPGSSGDNQNYGWLGRYEQPSPGGYILHRVIAWYKNHYREFLVPVGPILYIFQILAEEFYNYSNSWDLGNISPPPPTYHYEPTNGQPLDFGLMVVNGEDCPSDPGGGSESYGWTIYDVQCRAGLYSQELLEVIQSQGPVAAQQAYTDYNTHGWNYEWGTKYPNTFWQKSWDIPDLIGSMFSYANWPKWTEAKFYVRPHTKEELQAAGMWPVAAGA